MRFEFPRTSGPGLQRFARMLDGAPHLSFHAIGEHAGACATRVEAAEAEAVLARRAVPGIPHGFVAVIQAGLSAAATEGCDGIWIVHHGDGTEEAATDAGFSEVCAEIEAMGGFIVTARGESLPERARLLAA